MAEMQSLYQLFEWAVTLSTSLLIVHLIYLLSISFTPLTTVHLIHLFHIWLHSYYIVVNLIIIFTPQSILSLETNSLAISLDKVLI